MSKLFDNKQLMHIVAEVVILLSLTYNISSKFKTMKSYVDDICHRLDEQEEIMEKQTTQIETLTQQLKTLTTKFNMMFSQAPNKSSPQVLTPPPRPVTRKEAKPTVKPKKVESVSETSQQQPVRQNSLDIFEAKSPSCEMAEQDKPRRTSAKNLFEDSNIFSSITFIPMMGGGGGQSDESQCVDVEEIDSDAEEQLDQEISEELGELVK